MKNLAFTLAEVLIVLAIIGVVAAMTIPTLMENIQENEYKQAWKKEYSIINSAYEKMKADNGGDLSDYFTLEAVIQGSKINFYDNFAQYFLKSCKSRFVSGEMCGGILNSEMVYKTLGKQNLEIVNNFYGNYRLNDGADLYLRTYDTTFYPIWVDVNGYNKKPNVVGKDLFVALIKKDKIMPVGAIGTG